MTGRPETIAGPASRTRQSARRAPTSSVGPDPVPRRGTRRRGRRSVESIATNDFVQSSAVNPSPEPPRRDRHGLSRPLDSDSHSSPKADASLPVDQPADEIAIDVPDRIQDMKDHDLPKYSRWCGKMYDILRSIHEAKSNAAEVIQLPGRKRGFHDAQSQFAQAAKSLDRSPDLVDQSDPQLRHQIRYVSCSGDFVFLLLSILEVRHEKTQALPVWQQLEHASRYLFDPSLPLNSAHLEHYLHIAFKIRCRQLVQLLATHPSPDPLIVAATLFCIPAEPVSSVEEAHRALREGPYKQLTSANMVEDVFTDVTHSQLNSLVAQLQAGKADEVKQTLDQTYPQESLLQELWLWAMDCLQDINGQLLKGDTRDESLLPEANAIQSQSATVPLNNDNIEADSGSGSSSDDEIYDKLLSQGQNDNAIEDLGLAAIKISERNASGGSGRSTQNISAVENPMRHLDPDKLVRSARPFAPPRSSHSLVPEGSQGPFFGSQQTATRHGAVSREYTQLSPGADDEEDGFEVNQKVGNESRRVRFGDMDGAGPSTKRPRIDGLSIEHSRRRSSSVLTPNETDTEQQIVEYDTIRPDDLKALSQDARRNRHQKDTGTKRAPQVRVGWSDEETQRLLDLIADPSMGCSWARMEKAGGFETFRNQQSLRDRARNLKVLYLQGDKILPTNFDLIALGQKERNAVMKADRNPDRKENDVDDDGQIIMNHLGES
ncbi:hypothetical protein F4778DRAFT_400647 [Xylariomycetidae sp. FL2044]|nr:hypothetical protein F4778DRAFT_400647 [Xylariomycetidae sp. FL2044]